MQMKIRIRYNHWIPKLIKRGGVVLYPYVFISTSESEARNQKILNHELIHVKQVRKDGLMKFYINYIVQFILNFVRYRNFNKAYRNITYEQKARDKI